MRRLALVAAVALPLLPVSAQTPLAPITRVPGLHGQVAVTTATGVTHLDGLNIRDAASIDGRVRAAIGSFRLDASAATVAHMGVGRATVMRSELNYGGRIGDWSGHLGPLLRGGGGLGERATLLVGFGGDVVRYFGRGSIGVRLEEGLARIARQHSQWGKQGVSGTFLLGTVGLGVSWQRATVRDSMLRDNVFFTSNDPNPDTLFRRRVRSIHDVSMSAAWAHRELQLTVEAGQRAGDDVRTQFWWRGGATLEVAPTIALVANISRTPPDLLLGLRGGRSTMLGLRLNLAGARPTAHRTHSIPAAVESRRESPRKVRLIVALDARDRADVIGDATGWTAVPLTRRADGRWEAMLNAVPGVSRFNVSIDGGPWTTPLGVPTLADEFGGRAFLVDL
jgi:hypothetical protein